MSSFTYKEIGAKALGYLGSLKLTITCLVLLMVLVVSCTLAQVRLGTFGAVDVYIRSAVVMWPVPGSDWRIPIFPGGGAVGLVLLANLIAAHVNRLELSAKKAGLWAVHAGLIMLFAGEFVTGFFQVESHMSLEEGDTKSYSEDPRNPELAVVEEVAERDRVYAISREKLASDFQIEHPDLPFSLLIKRYYPNSRVETRGPGEKTALPSLANRGAGEAAIVFEQPRVSRDDLTDLPSAFVELVDGDRTLGTWLVSMALEEPQRLEYMGRRFSLALRPKRWYLPFALTLKDFRHEKHPGTDIPAHFSSLVRLRDPRAAEDREVLISMNQPLRHGGKAFYQSGFGKDDTMSILQVVENPGWRVPYAACALIAAGLLAHFALRFRPAVALVLLAAGAAEAAPFDLSSFSELPVVHQGRLKPIDTVARSSLLSLRGKQGLSADGRRLPPAEWLLDVFAKPEKADAYPVFRVDDPDIAGLLLQGAKERRYFSLNDLKPHLEELERQFVRAEAVEPAHRDRYQRAMVGLGGRILLYQRLKGSIGIAGEQEFLALPPLEGSDEKNWTAFFAGLMSAYHGGSVHPALGLYKGIVDAWRDGKAEDFNAAAAKYGSWLGERHPEAGARARREAAFNRADPFLWSQVLYVVAALLVGLSWLKRSPAAGRAAFAVALAAFALHSAGLLGRMLIERRPPVTNLYSSAVFVGWTAALLGLLLERRSRGGLGALSASAVGFTTLIIAHHLRLGGDTMEMMRAVLDSNFWLATHVVTITVGYAGCFLAAFIAHVYIFAAWAGKLEERWAAELSRQVYAVVCFSLFFSFVGTVLGGIWADQSWGRFWGWDPKENGALLIVLWNALILHARWGGYIRERGLMVCAVFGGIITSLSWFGVNMLGIGLHSYGFMDKAFVALASFIASQAAVMALGARGGRRA